MRVHACVCFMSVSVTTGFHSKGQRDLSILHAPSQAHRTGLTHTHMHRLPFAQTHKHTHTTHAHRLIHTPAKRLPHMHTRTQANRGTHTCKNAHTSTCSLCVQAGLLAEDNYCFPSHLTLDVIWVHWLSSDRQIQSCCCFKVSQSSRIFAKKVFQITPLSSKVLFLQRQRSHDPFSEEQQRNESGFSGWNSEWLWELLASLARTVSRFAQRYTKSISLLI